MFWGKEEEGSPEEEGSGKSCREMPWFPRFGGVTSHPSLEFPGSHRRFMSYKTFH